MKRALIVCLLVNLLLSACAPVTAPRPAPSATPLSVAILAPTNTATPTSTATPSPTPTDTATPSPTPSPTATATPTPIPTLPPEQVGGLTGVPDPRVTNPELFDLTRRDAPIPQFVNAMKNAGIGVPSEEVLNNLTFEHRQYPVRDENGNIVGGQMKDYVFAVWNLPKEMLPEGYQDLAGPIPILMAENLNGEWKWENYRVVPLRVFADASNILIGTNDEALDRSLGYLVGSHFNLLSPAWSFRWSDNQKSENNQNLLRPDKFVYANRNNLSILSGNIIGNYPDWLKNGKFSDEQLYGVIRKRLEEVMTAPLTKKVKFWIVKNEYHPIAVDGGYEEDFLHSRLGFSYVEKSYEEARKLRPDAILIYSDNASESPNWHWFNQTYQTVKRLKQKGFLDAVGLQAHINQPNWTSFPTTNEFARSIESFRELGLDVCLTELDISIHNKPNKDRLLYQALIYYRIISTYIQKTEGQKVRLINFWGLRDNESWLESYLNIPNADPLLFDDWGNPKIAYFSILSLLYQFAK